MVSNQLLSGDADPSLASETFSQSWLRMCIRPNHFPWNLQPQHTRAVTWTPSPAVQAAGGCHDQNAHAGWWVLDHVLDGGDQIGQGLARAWRCGNHGRIRRGLGRFRHLEARIDGFILEKSYPDCPDLLFDLKFKRHGSVRSGNCDLPIA